MGDRKRGLYEKFRVTRTDGKSRAGEKHAHCRYFVLDTDHDRHAIAALRAYAWSCAEEYPLLSEDVTDLAARMERELASDQLSDGRL